jgi:anti-sigma B factor antagonist
MDLVVKTALTGKTSARVMLQGELDRSGARTAARLLRQAVEEGRSDITVNLDGVVFLDSSGLAALMASLRFARERGGDVRLETSNEPIRRVLEISGLARVFKMKAAAEPAA